MSPEPRIDFPALLKTLQAYVKFHLVKTPLEAEGLCHVLKHFFSENPCSMADAHRLLGLALSSSSPVRGWVIATERGLGRFADIEAMITDLHGHLDPDQREENAMLLLTSRRFSSQSNASLDTHFGTFARNLERVYPGMPFAAQWRLGRRAFYSTISDRDLQQQARAATWRLTDPDQIAEELRDIDSQNRNPSLSTGSSTSNGLTAGRSRHVSQVGATAALINVLGALALSPAAHPPSLPPPISSSPSTGNGGPSGSGGNTRGERQRRNGGGCGGGASPYGPGAERSRDDARDVCYCCGNERIYLAADHFASSCNTHPRAFVKGYIDRPRNAKRVKPLRWLAEHEPHKLTFPSNWQEPGRPASTPAPKTPPPIPTGSTPATQADFRLHPPAAATARSALQDAFQLLTQHVADFDTHPSRRAALVHNLTTATDLAGLFEEAEESRDEEDRPNGDEPPAGFNH